MALGALRVLCANNKIEMGSVFVHGEEAFQEGNSTGAAMNNLISQTKKLNRVLARDSYIIRRSKKRSHPFFSAFYPIPLRRSTKAEVEILPRQRRDSSNAASGARKVRAPSAETGNSLLENKNTMLSER